VYNVFSHEFKGAPMKNKSISILIIILLIVFGVGALVTLFLMIGAGSLVTIASSSGEQPTPIVKYETPTTSRDPNLLITLERTACFGTCPMYTLTIYQDGRVEYTGKDFVTVKGDQTGKITPAQVQVLVEAFKNADYFNLQDEYTTPVTDLPTTITSFTFEGNTKTIRNYGGCLHDSPVPAPQALCDLENKIDEITNSIQWVGKR
jgi:hypothetical protein